MIKRVFTAVSVLILAAGIFAGSFACKAVFAGAEDLAAVSDDGADSLPEQDFDGRWLYGITVDDCWYDDVETEAVVAAIRDMPVKPTVRIVMSKEISPAEYEPLFSQIHEAAYILASPVDSWDMSAYEDVESYSKRFRDAYDVLAPYTDLWEIGNEINGTEWIGQTPDLIVKKVEAANAYIRSQGAKTALTLYYPGQEEQDFFPWINENLTEELTDNVDYALISYYEDDHDGYMPDWEQVFPDFDEAFSNAEVGFGECGNTAENAVETSKIEMARFYYSMEGLSENYVGGCFWWNWVQDCVPHEENPVYDEINRLMAEKAL